MKVGTASGDIDVFCVIFTHYRGAYNIPLVFRTGDGHLSQTQNGDCSDDDSFSESEDEDDEDADDENCSEYDSSCEE
jgi:hypothetical protein